MRRTIILQDTFGNHYRLHTLGEQRVRLPVEQKNFRDPVYTEQFVRGLRVPVDFWRPLMARFNPSSTNGYPHSTTMEAQVSQLLIRGVFKLYPVKHLNKQRGASSGNPIFPTLQGKQGQLYQLVPGSLLLVDPSLELIPFSNKNEAEAFLEKLSMDETRLNALVRTIDIRALKGMRDSGKQKTVIAQALLDGELIVRIKQQGIFPSKNDRLEEMPVQSIGREPASLGPHEEKRDASPVLGQADEAMLDFSLPAPENTDKGVVSGGGLADTVSGLGGDPGAGGEIFPGNYLLSKLDLAKLRAGPKSHTLERHGRSVTDKELQHRAFSGVAPDGSSSRLKLQKKKLFIPELSSKFNSDASMKIALNKVDVGTPAFNNALRIRLARNPNATQLVVREDLNADIGYGYKNPSVEGVSKGHSAIGPLLKVGRLRYVEAKYVLNKSLNTWELRTMFPTLRAP